MSVIIYNQLYNKSTTSWHVVGLAINKTSATTRRRRACFVVDLWICLSDKSTINRSNGRCAITCYDDRKTAGFTARLDWNSTWRRYSTTRLPMITSALWPKSQPAYHVCKKYSHLAAQHKKAFSDSILLDYVWAAAAAHPPIASVAWWCNG